MRSKLTPQQQTVLVLLSENPEKAITARRLAKKLGRGVSPIGRTLLRLEKDGLVARREASEDEQDCWVGMTRFCWYRTVTFNEIQAITYNNGIYTIDRIALRGRCCS